MQPTIFTLCFDQGKTLISTGRDLVLLIYWLFSQYIQSNKLIMLKNIIIIHQNVEFHMNRISSFEYTYLENKILNCHIYGTPSQILAVRTQLTTVYSKSKPKPKLSRFFLKELSCLRTVIPV